MRRTKKTAARHDQECGTHVAGQILTQRDHICAPVFVRVGILLCEPGGNGRDLRPRLTDRHPGFNRPTTRMKCAPRTFSMLATKGCIGVRYSVCPPTGNWNPRGMIPITV